jgi:hypothetical protein
VGRVKNYLFFELIVSFVFEFRYTGHAFFQQLYFQFLLLDAARFADSDLFFLKF